MIMSASSLSTFDVFARQKKLVDDLSVRFLRAALSISHLQRMSGFRPPYRMLRVQGNGFCNRSERRVCPASYQFMRRAAKVVLGKTSRSPLAR